MFHTEAGSVLHLCTKFMRIAQFIQTLLRGHEIRSCDPGHSHFGVGLWSLRREAPSSMSVSNLKRVALFLQKLLGVPNFAPLQTPFPGVQDSQNLISWRRSLPSPTDPVWWRSKHTISSYRGKDPQTHAARSPQTGPITVHCAAKLSMQCKDWII